jgi:pimeloyl-ACP methyl ester carboxylesterase
MTHTPIEIPTNDDTPLKGLVLRDKLFPGNRPVVLVIHGWKSSYSGFPELVKPLVEMGYVCVVFDLRGHGQTGGDLRKYSRSDHLNDSISAYDFVKTLDSVDVGNISVLGLSYGSYLACLLTTKRFVKNLVLCSPAQYQDEMFDEPQLAQNKKERRLYRLRPHGPQDNQALKAVEDFLLDNSRNMLIVEAEQDEQVPAQVVRDYVSVAGKRAVHVVIKGADHSFHNPGTNDLMIESLQRWFSEL